MEQGVSMLADLECDPRRNLLLPPFQGVFPKRRHCIYHPLQHFIVTVIYSGHGGRSSLRKLCTYLPIPENNELERYEVLTAVI
jgi:hypothetical protein